MRAGVVKMVGGHSSSSAAAALLAMMVVMMTMFITKSDCFSLEQNINVSSSTWSDGLNDDLSHLIGQTDLDSDEFMLDSEFSRRILAGKGEGSLAFNALNSGAPVSCDRKDNPKPCHSEQANKKAPPPHCEKRSFNRVCYKYPP